MRILTAWLIGWRSVIALAPGSFLAQYFWIHDSIINLEFLTILAIGLVVAPAAFTLFKISGFNATANPDTPPAWQRVMAAGVLASILNAIFSNFSFGSPRVGYLAYLTGDLFGLIFLILMLILYFRMLRAWGL